MRQLIDRLSRRERISIAIDTSIIISYIKFIKLSQESDRILIICQLFKLLTQYGYDKLYGTWLIDFKVSSITLFELREVLWSQEVEDLKLINIEQVLHDFQQFLSEKCCEGVSINFTIDSILEFKDIDYAVTIDRETARVLGWRDVAILNYCLRTGSYLLTLESGKRLKYIVNILKGGGDYLLINPCSFESLLIEDEKEQLKRINECLRKIRRAV